MANSRLANFGTIFSRMTGLIETGGVKDPPIWYNVYKKFPPDLEPRSDRPLPKQDPILEIVYREDYDRISKHKPTRNFVDAKPSAAKQTEEERKTVQLLDHIMS